MAEACTLGVGRWQRKVQEGELVQQGALEEGEVFVPAGGSLGPVVGVDGGAWCKCPILGNICFSAEPLHWFEHFDYLNARPLILSC